MWEMDYKESCVLKNWCFWTVVLEKTLESPLDYKEIQPVHPKGDQSWMFIGRTDADAESPILWSPDRKSWFIWKDPDAGKDWRWEEKGMTEDEMVGWHHWLNRHEFEWTPGVGDGQGGLACCCPWGCKELDTNERLNWTEPRSQNLCHQCQASVKLQLALHLLLVIILQFYNLAPPLPSSLSNSSCLFTHCGLLCDIYCTVPLWSSRYCTIWLKMSYFYLFVMYYLCKKYYKPFTVQYWGGERKILNLWCFFLSALIASWKPHSHDLI